MSSGTHAPKGALTAGPEAVPSQKPWLKPYVMGVKLTSSLPAPPHDTLNHAMPSVEKHEPHVTETLIGLWAQE